MDQADVAPRLTEQLTEQLTETRRATLQRRTIEVLALGQIVGSAAMGASVTVGAFVVEQMLGSGTAWAGIATATVTLGAAVFARVLSALMVRRGRRPGLALGYASAAVGGVMVAVAVEVDSLALLLAGLALFGGGQAANLLARYAATDLAAPTHRSAAMAQVVFFSTFGAVFGPVMIGPAQRAGQYWFGLERYSGPWLFAAILFVAAGLNIMVRLRPDPLVAAGQLRVMERVMDTGRRRESSLSTIGEILRWSEARLGLIAMVISQLTMVAVMAMTPVHMRLHGHEHLSAFVISLHIAGMYAFAPLVGRFCDRRGRHLTIVIGAGMLAGASLLAALAGDAHLLLFPALWLLGVGWNFGLIGGSSLLSESVPDERRVAVQGVADLSMSFFGAAAGFASGFIRRAWGFDMLAAGATAAAGVLLILGLAARRR